MTKRTNLLLLLLGWLSLAKSELRSSGPPLETRKQWNILSYNLPWDFPANDKEFYDPENVVATGIAVDYERIFIATPRLFSGVPSTLSAIGRKDVGDSPILQAYPSWEYHTAGTKSYNCSDLGLVSVYRMRIDSCNRLWALDAGVSRSLEDFEVTCPPKILVIDTNTDQVVRRIDFPREVIRGETLYTNLIIDETTSLQENHCDDVFVYISDTVEPAIVVYDSGRDLTWRLSHPAMYPDPNFAQSSILGHRFTLMDGIVGLAFDAAAGLVYFQPLATDRIFSVHTSALRAGPLPFGAELPVKLVGKKSSQGIGLAVSPIDGSIFFSPMSETAIAKWNPTTNKQKVLAFDSDQLQFVADIRAPARDSGSIYILSSKFHRFFLKNLDASEVNTRILRINGVTKDTIIPNYGNKITYGSHIDQIYGGPVGTTILPNAGSTAPELQPPTYLETYFNSVRQPYRYEPVGIINKSVNNPFTTLNTGERPEIFKKLQTRPPPPPPQGLPPKYGVLENNLYGNANAAGINTNFHDFNGLRFAKSTQYNTSITY